MRDDSYQQPYENYGGYAPPLAMPSEKADLLDKIKPNLIVDEVFHKLLGEVEKDGIWTADERLKSKSLSRVGAWDIATLMASASSQNVSLSKLKDAEIRTRVINICKTAQVMCLRNWKEYNINGIDQLKFVHQIIFNNTFVTLKQPQEEGIRKLLMGTMTAEIMPQQEEQKGGIIKSLFRR